MLPKSLYYCLTRFSIYRTSASGRRGRKAADRWKATKGWTGLTSFRQNKLAKQMHVQASVNHVSCKWVPGHVLMRPCMYVLCNAFTMHASMVASHVIDTRKDAIKPGDGVDVVSSHVCNSCGQSSMGRASTCQRPRRRQRRQYKSPELIRSIKRRRLQLLNK